MIRLLKILVIVAILAAGVLYYFLIRPYAGFHGETFVDIPKGASTPTIAQLLADSGVIEHPWQFLLARALRPSAKLPAGEFRFATPASTLDVYARIARGDVFFYELKIPEGLNMFDIAAVVESQGLTPPDFLAAARDPSLIRDLAPSAPTLEGYLFPDTYRVTHHTSAASFAAFSRSVFAPSGSGSIRRPMFTRR